MLIHRTEGDEKGKNYYSLLEVDLSAQTSKIISFNPLDTSYVILQILQYSDLNILISGNGQLAISSGATHLHTSEVKLCTKYQYEEGKYAPEYSHSRCAELKGHILYFTERQSKCLVKFGLKFCLSFD